MATTTNFGWETPDDTDLVKDGAAAIRTLGGAIDTSLVDLKGGTTGQVLSKASNTDMDFTWTADAGIPATIVDAKGDLIAATAADTVSRLAVGTNGQVLTADSTASTGLKWASASSPDDFTLLNSGGTSLTGADTITISSISGKNILYVVVDGASASASSQISIRFNSDTGSNYGVYGYRVYVGASLSTANILAGQNFSSTNIPIGTMSDNGSSVVSGGAMVFGANATGTKIVNVMGSGNASSGTGHTGYSHLGYYSGSSTISSVSIFSNTGNFDAGTVYVYASA